MEGAGELKWDIEPYNGRSSFFTPENYEKYSFKPSLVELWHLSQKQAAPVGVSNTEQKKTSSKTSNTKNPKEVLAAEDDLPMLEPQMAYPCFSSLTETEQKTYVKLMIKFLNFKPHLNQKKEYEHYQFLKVKTSKENAEFLKFLHNSARRFSEEYKWLSPDANLYTRKLLKACQVYVKKYPELYMVHKITSILGGKFIPNLTLNLEKCLLKMGSAKLGKLTFPTAETDLSAKINMANTTAEKAAILHTSVISDANAAKLASKYSPQVVLTSHTLYTLLNNHGPDYKEQWEIPLRVETISSGNTLKKIVFLDSPLPKKELTVKEKSEMYHEVPLDLYLSKKPDIFLKCVELDKDGDLFPKGTEDYSGRQETTYNMDVDFEHDLTELETFGSTEQIVKDSRHFESQELPNSLPVKSTLLEKLEIEKQVICSTNPKRTIDKTSEQSTASADELSLSDSVEMSSLEIFECDESLDFKKHHDERSSSDATIKNKMEIKHVSKILPSGPFDCTGNHSCGMDENQSDSEDDRLVIDFECAMKHKNKVGASPRDFSCITSPPDICTKESEYLPRKPAKTVSKMFDPVGQILKMQKKLLKPDRNKMQKQTPVSPENGPKPPEPTLINPPVFVTLESNQSNSVNRISHLRKSILPINLLASLEEENEYVPLPVGNCTYKLFSLDSMLLLIRSSIHKVCSKRTYKFGRKRVPAYILTKINYQSHYGVELLTENECCQLWTERLLHSSCLLYVVYRMDLTS
ncbi:hypothetical protein GDO86_006161 [Hymenochirus boettgeri]|uniref:Little elongation complex subunit 2 C-terminal domain-containing protein n=1 Tax=Hymenochirus boettgeri TaxID=247094 RepID=A0A8T2J989_9PIPI|nr:hypothetical protein GDO86_006161 [Hymenochirus boettgeri]